MHDNNKKWLDDLKNQYPDSFKDCKVVEVGSKDWNGSVRPWFSNCEYLGIDTNEGGGVNLVIDAAKFKWIKKEYFDVVISFSVLEHDLQWIASLANMRQFLKRGGMLFMCWGAEGNIRHNEPWAIVPHQEVLDMLDNFKFKVLDNFFEEDRYGKNCSGCYNIVAKKQ